MKNWALIIVAVYGCILVVLTLPVVLLAFAPQLGLDEAIKAFGAWGYWLWIAVMLLGQAALLAVPVRVANRRPVTQRALFWPVLAAGLMMGGLAVGAIYSILEFGLRDSIPDWAWSSTMAVGVIVWGIWATVFYRAGRSAEPQGVVSRQCRLLLKGSILELLIAVPTHIVARYRDYCCAGAMTFIGIALGISVMLFSFGPAVFFLYADRWRRLHPQPPCIPDTPSAGDR